MEACLFDRFVLFGDQIIFYPTIYLISESDLTSRVSICSIRRMENIMLDLTYCALHPKIASLYSDGNRLHFRRNKHVAYSENKHRR